MNAPERRSDEPKFGYRRILAVSVLVVLLLAVVPFVTNASITEIAFTGLVFVMLGVSWNLLAGYAGQISLGHAAFFGMGAFVSAWVTTPARAGLPTSLEMPILVSLPVGGLAAAIIALVIGPIMFRLRGHYFAIGTLALAAIIQLLMLDQRQFTGGSTGYYIDSDVLPEVMFIVALFATVLTVAVTYQITRSSPGLAMKAIHSDESAASSLGVNPLKYKMYAFVVSSFFAGLTGALYAQYTLYVNPETTLGVVWTIDTLVIVILGGMGSMAGPIFGAFLFLGLDNALTPLVGGLATSVEGFLIILIIIFLPNGLYGVIRKRFLEKSDEATSLSSDQPTAGHSEEQ
ncbi:branched-chain amino acid ABC transporter permease [Haladaptatus pallidirubidus]|uniref:Branched-chain amino acid ABC transporter permease n=1 Tax=Haladaptatus pallidirubidus TaxID=1008152 RepID=A0AAV3UNT7_9EURY|nr:branched-chain amino acid ABC transporter permease [Haladaptatus pallidirubidus]